MKDQIQSIIKFNQLAKRQVGDKAQYLKQLGFLNEEHQEVIEEVLSQDKDKLTSELADMIVVGVGGIYIADKLTLLDELLIDKGVVLMDITESFVWSVNTLIKDADMSESAYHLMCMIESINSFSEAEGLPLMQRLDEINKNNLGKFYPTYESAHSAELMFDRMGIPVVVESTGDSEYQYAIFAKDNSAGFKAGKLMKHVSKFSNQGLVVAA